MSKRRNQRIWAFLLAVFSGGVGLAAPGGVQRRQQPQTERKAQRRHGRFPLPAAQKPVFRRQSGIFTAHQVRMFSRTAAKSG